LGPTFIKNNVNKSIELDPKMRLRGKTARNKKQIVQNKAYVYPVVSVIVCSIT